MGTALQADSGVVIVTRVGLVAVHRPYRDHEQNVVFAPGDTIVLLDYLGEGYYNAWVRGRLQEVVDDWGHADTSATQLLVEPQRQWWTHVTWRSGGQVRRGWIDMDRTEADGTDACGV
jgi:hypothetical protein